MCPLVVLTDISVLLDASFLQNVMSLFADIRTKFQAPSRKCTTVFTELFVFRKYLLSLAVYISVATCLFFLANLAISSDSLAVCLYTVLLSVFWKLEAPFFRK